MPRQMSKPLPAAGGQSLNEIRAARCGRSVWEPPPAAGRHGGAPLRNLFLNSRVIFER
jgi:hypothetical protein